MNTAGDTADKFASFLLEGTETFFRIAGSGSKNMIGLISAILNEQKQTKGKTRLTNMLKSGKALKIYSFKAEDLKKFSEEAKKYGVLYSVLANKKNQKIDGIVDVMIAEEDAPKVSRIAERFNFAEVDIEQVERDIEQNIPSEIREKTTEEIANEIVFKNVPKEEVEEVVEDTLPSKEDKSEKPLLETSLNINRGENEQEEIIIDGRESVRKDIKDIKEITEKLELENKNIDIKEKIVKKLEERN